MLSQIQASPPLPPRLVLITVCQGLIRNKMGLLDMKKVIIDDREYKVADKVAELIMIISEERDVLEDERLAGVNWDESSELFREGIVYH